MPTRTNRIDQGVELYRENLRQSTLRLKAQENPLFCPGCDKTHTRFGMEIEIDGLGITDRTIPNDFKHDSARYSDKVEHLFNLRIATLQKLEGTFNIDEYKSDFGLDGSGSAFELRNINADTPALLAKIASERLSHFFKECDRTAKEFEFTPRFSTRVCGIHVHHYHRGVNRIRVVSAHAIVGAILNFYSPDDWRSRLDHSYGEFFAHRTDTTTSWCNVPSSETSTELRQFNAVHMDTFQYCLETQEKIIETSKKHISRDGFRNKLLHNLMEANKEKRISIPAYTYHNIYNMEMTLYIPIFIAWAINQQAVKFEIARELVSFLNSEYRPLFGEPDKTRKLDFNEVEKNLEILSRNETPEILPYTWYCEQIESIRGIGRNGRWCLDNLDSSGNRTRATNFQEYENHMRSCRICEINLRIIADNGNKIVTEEGYSSNFGSTCLYATLKPIESKNV